MKIIAISDLHLTLKENYGIVSEEGLNSRVFDKLKALSIAVKYAIDNKADLFIDTGDTFDLLNPPEILRYKFIEAISPLLEAGIQFIIIMGNHVYNANYYNLQSEEKLLRILKTSKMEIINTPTIREINTIPLIFMPWNYIEQAKEFLKAHPNHLVFHHLPIKKALLNDYEIKSKEGLDDNDLNNQIALIGGHYHKHQIQDNWCYVGSLVKQDFSERNQKKGFLEINIQPHLSDIDIKFIEIPDRDFLQLEFSEPQNPIEFIKSLDNLNGAVIKSIFTGSNSWLYNINKSEYLKTLETQGALRVLQPEYLSNESFITKPTNLSSRSSFENNITYYCEEKNKKEYEKLMQTILIEVQNSRKVI